MKYTSTILTMRGARENQKNTRTLSGYFSPRIKVKEFALEKRSPHHINSFAQETPMKPSQVPNRLPHPVPRTMVPFHTHHFPVSPCQDQRRKQTPSNEKLSPVVDLSSSSLKRRREFEDSDHSAVKVRRQGENSCKAPTPKPTVGNFLSTSLVPQPSTRQSLASEQLPKSTDSQHQKGPVCGQSSSLEPSPKFKPTQSPCASPTPEICIQRQPVMGAKQAYIQCTQSHILRIMDNSPPSKHVEESLKTRSEASEKKDKHRTLCSSGIPSKDNGSSPPSHSAYHRNTSSSPVRTSSRGNQGEKKKSDGFTPRPAAKPNSDSQSGHAVKRSKTGLSKKCVSVTDDINDLFTPDPMTYVVSPTHKTSKPKTDERVTRSSTSGKSCSPNTVTSPCTATTGSSSGKTQNVTTNSSPHAGDTNIFPVLSQSQRHQQLSMPFVTLKRVKLENPKHKNGHSPSSSMQCKDSTVKSEKHKSPPNTVRTCTLETDTAASGPSSAHPCNGPPVMERQANEEGRRREIEVDPLDEELVTTNSSPHAGDTDICPVLSQSQRQQQLSMPFVALRRVNLENLKHLVCKDKHKNSHSPSSSTQCKDSTVKSEKHKSRPNTVRTCTLETDTAASGPSSAHPCNGPPVMERQANEEGRRREIEVDPLDEELDFDLSLALDVDLAPSSHSSEDEQLLSLQEMMVLATRLPDTPEKDAFSEPGTPGPHCCKLKPQQLPPTTNRKYKNSLDEMLKEINTTKKSNEIGTQLLASFKEDLLGIAERKEAEEMGDNGISIEHQEFLRRFELACSVNREVPPGEEVFNLEKFGQIFNHDTLQLRKCMVKPEGAAQKALLWSSPAQLRLHLNIGLFHEAYNCRSPCPTPVTRFLFKMMSVHNERMVSENILQTLCDIASTAAYQIVKNGSQDFEVWVPSLADVALVLLNMGVSFVTLFPFENLQPPFTEGDLLEDVYVKAENSSSDEEQRAFPEHNCISVIKYLSCCMGLCTRAYSDHELLLLLTVVGKVGLDQRLILLSPLEMRPLLHTTVQNFSDWNDMLPRICLALSDLTDDHHNMCQLVKMLPDNTRGNQLRRHLSLSMISKLLDGSCTYSPTESEIQLSDLRRFLPRMKPSALLRNMQRSHRDKEDMTTMDQQSYYLCYSLLTLTNEASNLQFFLPYQKKELLSLCADLGMHVKGDIRESGLCLYRSKVLDLLARIDTKWQMILRKTKPLNGKLYDYCQPLSVAEVGDRETEERDLEMMADDDTEEKDQKMDVLSDT